MMDDIWVMENAGYVVEKGKPVILLFSRNYRKKFETITHRVHGFRPYFYCPATETNVELPKNCEYDKDVIIDALGREVIKVYVDIPRRVAEIRDNYSFTDMSDFLFEKRFLVDYKIKYAYTWDGKEPHPIDIDGILEPRIVYFDIEVLSPNGIFPKPEDSKYPVVSIQVMDSYTEKIIVFTNGIPQHEDIEHFACKDEKALFKMFLEYIKSVNPDVITAWNGEQYDIPYLIRRSWQLGININDLARYGKVSCEYNPLDGKFRSRLNGRSSLDMLLAFKKFTSGMAQRESYALKSVISDSELLDKRDENGNIITKYAFSYKDLGAYMQNVFDEKRWGDFLQYCKNDVIALNNINNAVNLINFYENIRFISGCKMDDVLFNSKIIELLICHEGIRPMPNNNHAIKTDDTFEGATVITPKPGISEYMATFDLSSLYPTILISFQKSPDVDKIVLKTLEKTMEMREELRRRCKEFPDNTMLENQQMAIKFLNNSYYGVLGLQSFRLYDRSIAEFVTSTGRELNKFLQSVATAQGYEVIFGDTDSIGVILVKTVQIGKQLESILNTALSTWSKDRKCTVDFKLKFEKLYRRVLFKADKNGEGVKKKYCGYIIWEEGRDKSNMRELNYKGLELKRSDQAEITRDCLHYFLEKSLIDGNTDDAVAYVKKLYNDVKSGNVNIFNISLPKAIRKVKYNTDNAWVRGINRASTDYNYLIQEGVKPRLIYLRNGEICIDEDFDISLIKDLIDYNVMAEKVIKNKMESYMWSIGYDWNTIIHGQCSLDAWL